jgi:hypothetical protein
MPTSASALGQLLRVRSAKDEDVLGEPFASKAQARWAFATKQPFAKEFADKTNFKKLPVRKSKHKEGIDPLPLKSKNPVLALQVRAKKDDALEVNDPVMSRQNIAENVDWGSKSVPGPFDAKTLRKDTTSPKTSHKDEIDDYPSNMTTMASDKGKTKKATKETLVFNPRLLEGTYDPATRTANVIIIAEGMGNRRDKHYYGADTLQDAVVNHIFDGAQAYADHPSASEETDRPERSIRDLFGYYFDSRITESNGRVAISAKLKIQEGQDWAIGLIKEAIEYSKKFPDKVYAGISINADGDVAPSEVNGQEVNYVHRITDAFSADVVTKPARGGKFLALIESASGAHKGANMTANKLAEAAAALRAQMRDKFVDPSTLESFLKEAEAVEAAYCATKEAKESKGSDDGVTDAKESKSGNAVADTVDKRGVSGGVDADNDEDDEAKVKEGKAFPGAVAPFGKAKESESTSKESKISESDVSKSHPTLFASALTEARRIVEADSKSTIDDLRKKLAEANARQSLRESYDVAVRKVQASSLPDGAAVKLMESLVGRTPEEMDRLIENESKYLAEIGVTAKKTIGGNPERVQVRESDIKANTSAIFAGLGE